MALYKRLNYGAAAAAAAKLLQSWPTLYDPIDGSPPGSPVPGILQARTLEWVAISFSSTWKWKVKVKSLSCVQLLVPHGCSLSGSSVHRIFQARVLEWGAIAFSEPWSRQLYYRRVFCPFPLNQGPSADQKVEGSWETGGMSQDKDGKEVVPRDPYSASSWSELFLIKESDMSSSLTFPFSSWQFNLPVDNAVYTRGGRAELLMTL